MVEDYKYFKRVVLIYFIFILIFNIDGHSEEIESEIENLKKQINEIQFQNKKMIEEIQQKSQEQIDDLRNKIELMESQRQTDKDEIQELKAKNNIENIINTKLDSLDEYVPRLKFNRDFPSYFRSRARFIENATFFGAVPGEEDEISFADSRLLFSPMLEVTDKLSLRSQIDIAKNIIWGGIGDQSSSDKVFEAPSPSDSFRGAVLREVTDTFSGNSISPVDDDIDFFDIRTLYFVANTSIGDIYLGRQPYDYALGILANAGSMPDQDFGTIVDRFEFDTAPFAPLGKKWENLILVLTYDILSQGNTLANSADGSGWEGGIGALYFGDHYEMGGYVYVVNQERFDLSGGLTGDLDHAIVWSLYGKYEQDPYYFAFELEDIFGNVTNLEDPLPLVVGDDEIDVSLENFLLVIRIGYNPPPFFIDRVVAEFGWSSGDDSTTPDKLEGNAIFFNNAYVLDNLLFKHIIPNVYALEGSVINSGYLRAYTTLKLSDSLTLSPQIVFAWTDETNALLGIDGLTPLPKVHKYLATELESILTWNIMDHLWFDLIGSVVIPGKGLDDLLSQRAFIEGVIPSIDDSSHENIIYGIQGRFIFTLDSIIKKWTGYSTLSKRAYF